MKPIKLAYVENVQRIQNAEYAVERILHELDNWQSHLEYYMTAWGGEPDPKNVAICEAKIAELNIALMEVA